MDEALHASALGPSTLGEILDRTAQIYRSRFLVFFGIAAVPTVILLVFAGVSALLFVRIGQGAAGASPLADGLIAFAGFSVLGLIGLPAMLGATALATAALSHAAARSVFAQSFSISDSYRAVWKRGWRYIGLFAVQIAAVWVIPFTAWTLLFGLAAALTAAVQAAGIDPSIMLAIAVVAIIVGLVTYGFWISLRLALAFPACVVEQVGAWAGIKRSNALGKGSRGRMFVLYLLSIVLNWVLSLAIWVPSFILLEFIPGADSQKHHQTFAALSLIIVYGAGFAVQAFTRPVVGIALTLFYYDQRIRQEAFDIEWMMLKAGLTVPVATPPVSNVDAAIMPLAEEPAPTEPASIQPSLPDPALPDREPPAQPQPSTGDQP